MVDYLDLALTGAITFAAVFVGFGLALWQDKLRERKESSEELKGLLTLFKDELNEIAKHLRYDELDVTYPISSDAWDSARASGKLSLLPNKEFGLLKGIYQQIRDLNVRVDDFNWRNRSQEHSSDSMAVLAKMKEGIISKKKVVSDAIAEAQEELGWTTTRLGPRRQRL